MKKLVFKRFLLPSAKNSFEGTGKKFSWILQVTLQVGYYIFTKSD